MNPFGKKSTNATHWLWLMPPVILADQLSKWLIVEHLALFDRIQLLPIFDIVRLHNYGAAFSFLNDASGWQRWLFVVLGIGVTIFIVFWLRRLPTRGQGILAAGLAFVASGALGNVIDRTWHGYVVYFLSFHYAHWYFPAFNVADISITIGAGLLILDMIITHRREKRAGNEDANIAG